MWENVGIYRNDTSLRKALSDIENIQNEFGKNSQCSSKEEYELRNMIITAGLIVVSALERKESRGAHYRLDYLNADQMAKHSLIINKKGE